MSDKESLSDSIRRKVAERQSDALKAISECETTEVSASHARPKALAVAAVMNPGANPLLPVCIGLAVMVVVLLMLLLMKGMH
jgi:hypothetical protein